MIRINFIGAKQQEYKHIFSINSFVCYFSLERYIILYCIFLLIIFIGNVALSNNEILKKTKGIIKYLVLTFFVVFLRNNGIYIVFITLFVLIISHFKY